MVSAAAAQAEYNKAKRKYREKIIKNTEAFRRYVFNALDVLNKKIEGRL